MERFHQKIVKVMLYKYKIYQVNGVNTTDEKVYILISIQSATKKIYLTFFESKLLYQNKQSVIDFTK